MSFKIETKRNMVLSKTSPVLGVQKYIRKVWMEPYNWQNLRALSALSPGDKDECVTSITNIISKTAKDVWSFQCEMQKNDR